MLDRIIMDIIHVSFQVGFIPDLVFPIPALPDPSFPLGDSAGTNIFIFR